MTRSHARIAALYDVHGNLPALEAALAAAHAEGVEAIVVGGDVFPGPMSLECLARLESETIPVQFISGNGDRDVLELSLGRASARIPHQYRPVMQWLADRLSPEVRRTIEGWPGSTTLHVEGIGGVFFCHATPASDTAIFTRQTPLGRLIPVFDSVRTPLVVCGHTHMQFDRTVGAARIVNAGSVGMPFGEPGAYWLLLGPGVTLQRTGYDLAAAAAAVRQSGYPQADEFASRNILSPPTEEEMLAVLQPAELR